MSTSLNFEHAHVIVFQKLAQAMLLPKGASGNIRTEAAWALRGFFPCRSLLAVWKKKINWIMKQSIYKHPSDKSHKVTSKVLVHLFICFSCTFICMTLCLEDCPWQRNSRVLAWINMSKCSSDVHATSVLLPSFARFSVLAIHLEQTKYKMNLRVLFACFFVCLFFVCLFK